ncbi:MAG: rod shape-determining protein RodA [Candidatus Omnitrophota bacterium]|nr:rod shape-determining protein RodA [Candidatus Omnitrophota bacterium]
MRRDLDKTIWVYTMLIMGAGLIALYSATYQNPRVPHKIFFDQLIGAGLGLSLMFYLGRISYRKFYDVAYVFYGINIFLLCLVLWGGREALGAQRWLQIGAISFQPSELTKLSLILMLGRYFSNRRPAVTFTFLSRTQKIIRDLIFPLILTGVTMSLVFKQPDLGTAILLFGIFMIMLFATDFEYKYFFMFFGLLIFCVPFVWHLLHPYQKDRLLVFLNPNIDPLGVGYTIIQSKIAMGSGQLWGKGWLAGTQSQLNFLPERHTDFIFSVIGEEWGFIGTLFIVYCFFMLINCALDIANQVNDPFGKLVTVGIVGILALQAVINIGMVMGLFPVVGITLPFVSYGRSSFLIFTIMMGFLLNLSKKRTVF